MRTAFIFHGTGAGPNWNWFPWLKKELEKLGLRVFVPQFPAAKIKDGQEKLNDWLAAFEKYKQYVKKDTIIIAHSKGAVFTYHLLPTLEQKIQAVFLVAPWFKYHWYKKGKPVSSFHAEPFRWERLKNSAKHFEVYQSTNDIIEIWEGEKIAKDVGGKVVIVKNAGHFNIVSDPKFDKFELLLKNIKPYIKKTS